MKLPVSLNSKGFTLIELLVVIAVLGILASVVLVAINPAERIKEAQDSGAESNVSQVATAVEACFTANIGSYDACNTLAELQTGGFIKNTTALSSVTIAPATANPANLVVYQAVTAAAATCDSGTGTPKYYRYQTSTGVASVLCGSTPTP